MGLALLFAVFSNTAYLLSDEQLISAALDPVPFRRLAPGWFQCSFSTFLRCGAFSRPSLMACQAIVTLNYSFHLSGNSRIHAAMPHMNIGMCRAINLHLLGSSSKQPHRNSAEREIGRYGGSWSRLSGIFYPFIGTHVSIPAPSLLHPRCSRVLAKGSARRGATPFRYASPRLA